MVWNKSKQTFEQAASKAPGKAAWWWKIGLPTAIVLLLCGALAWHQRAQKSLPLTRQNIVGDWRSQSSRFLLQFNTDGSFEMQERETKGPILLTGLGLAKPSGKWQIDHQDHELHFGGIIVAVKRLSKERMVIQFGNKPPVTFDRKAQ